MFLMYLVMDYMHWICYVFEHSSSIWSVTEQWVIYLFHFIFICLFLFIYLCYLFIQFFWSPADNRIDLFVCSYIRKMNVQMEKQPAGLCMWVGCAYINRHRDISVNEICRIRRKRTKRWWYVQNRTQTRHMKMEVSVYEYGKEGNAFTCLDTHTQEFTRNRQHKGTRGSYKRGRKMYWNMYVYLDVRISVHELGRWEMKIQMGRSLGMWTGLCVHQ